MPHHYDAIVIGAGHNGLTCACYLAKAGLKVLLLEQYHRVGGMTVTEEETLPRNVQKLDLNPTVDKRRGSPSHVRLQQCKRPWIHFPFSSSPWRGG
jgi:flavin-dependent dehydrogenase